MMEDGLGEYVKSKLLGRIGSRVEYVVVHPWVRDEEEEVLAVALLGPRAHHKGLRLSVNDGPRVEGKVFVRPQGFGVAGTKPGESDPFWDQGGREPRELSGALVGILLHVGE